PFETKIDQPLAGGQGPEFIAVAIAKIDLLGIEQLDRRERGFDVRGGSWRTGRRWRYTNQIIQRRWRSTGLGVAVRNESDGVSVRRPGHCIRKCTGHLRCSNLPQKLAIVRIHVDAKRLAWFIGGAVEGQNSPSIRRGDSAEQRIIFAV